uniref:ABC transporter domain-containing protein n=1 Tax=Amphora coffeiformis TaxID=265554 RepID=A0A7S3PDN2_9STRA
MATEIDESSSSGLTPSEAKHLLASIQELLHICEENQVPISADLKASLLAPTHLLQEHDQHHHHDDHDTTRPKSQQEVLSALSASARMSLSTLGGGDDVETTLQPYQAEDDIPLLKDMREKIATVKGHLPLFELHIQDGSYTVTNYLEDGDHEDHRQSDNKDKDNSEHTPRRAKQKIQTVGNNAPAYKIYQLLKKIFRGESLRARKEETVIMQGVNLVIEPGKQYLVLGAPGSGKSTLLKMISNNLHQSKDHVVGGKVTIDGVSPSKDLAWSNLVGYIDQIDRLHPYLTVRETCEFAWKCRSGSTHRQPWFADTPQANETIAMMDEEMVMVNKVLEGLGLMRVQDTFVGDQSTVRGVSGGEKKRVTVAEMMCAGSPILCGDEISTGLDAATTFDITKLSRAVCRIKNSAMLISLLQPPPETVANFDEMIIISEGRVIYAGPVDEVIDHFSSLGYKIPERMDVADWLQALATKDGWVYLADNISEAEKDKAELTQKHLSSAEFMLRFYASEKGKKILAKLASPPNSEDRDFVMNVVSQRYRSSHFECLKLVVKRELLLWWRDKYAIKAKVGQSLAVGVIAGTMYWQTTDSVSVVGVLFQSMFVCVISAMLNVAKQFPDRSIFYKQQDANFFPTWTYVLSRTASNLPAALTDAIMFGTIIFWFVGLSWDDGASIANYFLFLFLLFVTSMTANAMFSIFPAVLPDVTTAQASMAVLTVMLVLFSGFTVQADVIPE